MIELQMVAREIYKENPLIWNCKTYAKLGKRLEIGLRILKGPGCKYMYLQCYSKKKILLILSKEYIYLRRNVGRGRNYVKDRPHDWIRPV